MVRAGDQREGLVAASGVRSPDSHARALLLRAEDAVDDQPALMRAQLAMRPASTHLRAFSGVVAHLARPPARGHGVLPHVNTDLPCTVITALVAVLRELPHLL